jgi:hypothetical protein
MIGEREVDDRSLLSWQLGGTPNPALIAHVQHALNLQVLPRPDLCPTVTHGLNERSRWTSGDGKVRFHLLHQFHRLGIIVDHILVSRLPGTYGIRPFS